jgi:IclR family pca regulon transcriptional regulator
MNDFDLFAGDPDFVLSLARGLAVIEAFQDEPDGVTIAGVAATTGLSRAAVRRLIITLEQLGYANRKGVAYRLTSRVLKLGASFLSSDSLAMLAGPILEEISGTLHESSSVSVLDGSEIVYVARSVTKRVMSVGLSIGSRLPACYTSMGRVLLAALPEAELNQYLKSLRLEARTPKTIVGRKELSAELARVRRQGFSLVDEELEIGLRSLAVPVTDGAGQVVAAMNTGVHVSRISVRELKSRMLPVLQDGAARLGQALSWNQPSKKRPLSNR